MNVQEKERVKKNVFDTFNRLPHEWVPCMPRIGTSLLDYSGTNYWDILTHMEDYEKVMLRIFDEGVTMDCGLSGAIRVSPEKEKLLHGCVQTKLCDDGITLQHLQNSLMTEEDYSYAIANLPDFIANTMLRRKMPFLFEGDARSAAKTLEAVIKVNEDAKKTKMETFGNVLTEKFGTYIFSDPRFPLTTPGDIIFDNYRGFKGTLTDLRRHYNEMKEFADVIWELNYANHYDKAPLIENKFPCYMSHVPAFLNPKQYGDLCYKYFKVQLNNIAEKKTKAFMLAEGTWAHLWDYFLDLPKDCIVINVENDDLCDVYDKIGHYQLLVGGSKLVLSRMESVENNIEHAKRVIDHCAPGNAFIFGSDKSSSCKGDVNKTWVEVFKFAAEYGKY